LLADRYLLGPGHHFFALCEYTSGLVDGSFQGYQQPVLVELNHGLLKLRSLQILLLLLQQFICFRQQISDLIFLIGVQVLDCIHYFLDGSPQVINAYPLGVCNSILQFVLCLLKSFLVRFLLLVFCFLRLVLLIFFVQIFFDLPVLLIIFNLRVLPPCLQEVLILIGVQGVHVDR